MDNKTVQQGSGIIPCFIEDIKEFLEGPTAMSYAIADAFTCDINTAVPPSTPERGLLAAILWRSFADLESHIEAKDRKAAINWFRSSDDKIREDKFTFSEIASYLNLGELELKVIFRKIEEAEDTELQREQTLSELYRCSS